MSKFVSSVASSLTSSLRVIIDWIEHHIGSLSYKSQSLAEFLFLNSCLKSGVAELVDLINLVFVFEVLMN